MKTKTLFVQLVGAIVLAGCLTSPFISSPSFIVGQTTLDQLTDELGKPAWETRTDDHTYRDRWIRTSVIRTINGYTGRFPETYFDAEFEADGKFLLLRWRAVREDVSISDDSGFVTTPSDDVPGLSPLNGTEGTHSGVFQGTF